MTTDDSDAELPGQWSDLSRAMRRDADHDVLPGTSYLGWETALDSKRGWLPQSIEDVDNLIEQNLR